VTTKKFDLQITGSTTAYLKLPTHPEVLRNAKSVTLVDLLGAYKGPYVVFDFDSDGVLVGIEIVGDDDNESEEEKEEDNVTSMGFLLNVSDDDGDVAYLRLPSYPEEGPWKMSKSVRLRDVMGPYEGPDIVLDFDMRGVLVGIEVLA
jgi:uncharacterized protein YuzE